jgi:S1-C subfamily serine protease
MYIGKSRSFVEEDKQDDCEKAHMTCEFSEHQLTVVVDLPGAVARNEYGFDEGTYIGMALHLVGMPHIAETAVNAVRKLRITKPEIDIYLDPVADDEIYIAVAPDLDKLKQVLGEPKKKRGITSGSVAQSTGTGFLITRQGHVLTNSHVVDECNEIKVVTKGERVESVLVSQDSRNDIAILKIPGNFEVSASFRGGRGIRPGDEIIALGYPLQGLLSDDLKITQGIVNALAGLENDTRMMQISAPVQPGNSGGPLLDQAGNVVGIVTAKMNAVKMAEYTGDIPQNINFAIKASLARDFLDIKEIDYEISQSRDAQKLTDVFQQAKKFTVPIECW